ncbi:MAG: hypothetical protein SVM79_05970 [Chloroflexota bacterium]|nr:hypothetical protein [Chloroflexota bacterium]
MGPIEMNEVIGGKRYNTETAILLAGNDYWDGHNFERHGHNTYLFKGKSGSYFAQHLTQWQGEQDKLEPLDEEEAVELFERLSNKRVDFEDAFPNITVAEA